MVFAYLAWAAGTQRHTHIIEPEYVLTDEVTQKALADFERMASAEPMQYVMGQAHFYGRVFKVNPSVLIPRPETEILCREAVQRIAAMRGGSQSGTLKIADLCTGSGCIAWTMALECPGADVVAVDISDGAIETASSQNFSDESLPAEVQAPRFIKSDVLDSRQCSRDIMQASGLSGKFDVILSNPPYVKDSEKALMRKNVLEHEPWLALFVSDEDPLLFYRAVASWAKELLNVGGLCLVEINEALGAETAQVFVEAGFHDVEVLQDLNSRDRFVRAIQ